MEINHKQPNIRNQSQEHHIDDYGRKGYMYMADTVTDPRWQRTYGTFGEDPEFISDAIGRLITYLHLEQRSSMIHRLSCRIILYLVSRRVSYKSSRVKRFHSKRKTWVYRLYKLGHGLSY